MPETQTEKASIKDRVLFHGSMAALQTIFTVATVANPRLRAAVAANKRIKYVFRYRDIEGSVSFKSYALSEKEMVYTIEFVNLGKALAGMLENPKNVLDLMISGKIRTDGRKNPYYLFLLGYFFSEARPYFEAHEPAFFALLDLMGVSRSAKRDKKEQTPKKQWAVPDCAGMTTVERLAEEMRHTRPHVSIENARFITEYFKKNQGSVPVNELWAGALKHSFERRTIRLNDGPIVGSVGEHLISTAVFPWLFGSNIMPDLTTLNRREKDPTFIDDAQIETLVTDIFPFWADNNPYAWAKNKADRNGSYKSFHQSEMLAFYMLTLVQMASHIIPNYEFILKRGLLDMIREAGEKQSAAQSAGDADRASFFKSQAIVLQGVLALSRRYADACEEQARSEPGARREELIEIAQCLRNAPAHPARSLHEALLAMNMLRVALNQENFCSGLSIGRLDTLINPYYEQDIQSGRITRERAFELIASFLIRLNDVMPLVPDSATIILGGTPPNQAVTIGPDLNECARLILEATKCNLLEPNLCVRNNGSDELLKLCVDVIGKTGASLALFGDKANIAALAGAGLSQEDARGYGIVGCVEPTGNGDSYAHSGSIMLNAASIMELAVFGGWHHLAQCIVTRATTPLSQCETFEEFYANFCVQMNQICRSAGIGSMWLWKAHQKLCPTPLLSAFIKGTWDKGRDVTRGGAKYNSSGVTLIGMVNVVDSLCAIKELVYEKKLISPADLEEALLKNYETEKGQVIRALLLNKAPKFGRDEEATLMALDVEKLFADTFHTIIGPRGERHLTGNWSMSYHAGAGAMTGATPDGRLAGSHLTSGVTPSHKGTEAGTVEILRATAGLRPANGIAVNLIMDPETLLEPSMIAMLQVYFAQLEGMQVQITAHSEATLRDAMKHPENHTNLIVRVSGYNARFVDLSIGAQLEMIGRYGNHDAIK